MPYRTGLVLFDKNSVDTHGTRSSREAQNKGVGGGRVEILDSFNDVVGHVGAGLFGVVPDDESHFGKIKGVACVLWM